MEDFFDKAQPEYLFMQFFGLQDQVALIKETTNQFFIKAPLYFIMFVLFRFFVLEQPLSIFGFIMTCVLFYLIVYLTLIFLIYLNHSVKRVGLQAVLVCILLLFGLILVM
ncbi:MAG: hypothetical protein ABIG95_06215 [Candidatus Woesearchaeota archaeon]